MVTKVFVCGHSECTHCSSENKCKISGISLDKEGQCLCYRNKEERPTSVPVPLSKNF